MNSFNNHLNIFETKDIEKAMIAVWAPNFFDLYHEINKQPHHC